MIWPRHSMWFYNTQWHPGQHFFLLEILGMGQECDIYSVIYNSPDPCGWIGVREC
jgi:hypothetical protein